MKTFRFLCMAITCMAMVLVSCSGSDGETGPQGKQGIAGADGADGIDGDNGISCWDLNGNGVGDAAEDINDDGNFDALDCQGEDGQSGQDGNANVQEHLFSLELLGDYEKLVFDLNDIVDTPTNYAYLYYIDTQANNLRYSIPGSLINNTHYARVYTDKVTGSLVINFYDKNDDPYVVPGNQYKNFVVVSIELSTTGKTSENIMAELKDAGVDISDYDAVAEYFGLDK